MHAHTHTTRAVVTTDNCFARSGAHKHGKVIGVMNRVNPHLKNPWAYCRSECKAVYQASAPHNTCGSCWLGTAQQFYHDMRGEGGSRVTSKLKPGAHIHQPTTWSLPHEQAQPYHTGSGSHGHLFRQLFGAHQHGIAFIQLPGKTPV